MYHVHANSTSICHYTALEHALHAIIVIGHSEAPTKYLGNRTRHCRLPNNYADVEWGTYTCRVETYLTIQFNSTALLTQPYLNKLINSSTSNKRPCLQRYSVMSITVSVGFAPKVDPSLIIALTSGSLFGRSVLVYISIHLIQHVQEYTLPSLP
jgi:hypothetical protein